MMSVRPDEDGNHLLQVIESAWYRTQQHWQDDMASHFDRRHWAPLVNDSRAYLSALSQCLDLLRAAERDTEF